MGQSELLNDEKGVVKILIHGKREQSKLLYGEISEGKLKI